MSTLIKKQPECGVIYVAVGEQCAAEAKQSLDSLRQSNPGLTVMLLTDAPPKDPGKWDAVEVDASLHGQRNRAKLFMDRAPYDRCLFLDSDTLVCGDLMPGFALLDRFELCGEQVAGGHHYELPGLPPSFPEINSGVLFWKPTEKVRKLFEEWRRLYDELDQSQEARKWDQKSLRYAVWQSDVRFARLPSAFNVMPYYPAAIERELVVAHGRSFENLLRLQQRLSKSTEFRAYVPGLGEMHHPQTMSWRDSLWVIWRILAWKMRGLVGR
jgi:hypothetical protein